MVVFPGCKINLGLRILDKRADGYHNIETIFYPVAFSDVLEIIPSPQHDPLLFSSSGLPIDGNTNDNLCVKAYSLLKKDFPQLPPVKMHLHKSIPMGAGLGGGSSDAAFALTLLNRLFNLQLSTEQLIVYAVQLGSDCPFFVLSQPCLATGRGEIMQPLSINLSEYTLVLVNPGVHVNTRLAFEGLQLSSDHGAAALTEIIQQPVESWRNELINDFEKFIGKKWPVISEIKELLYSKGAGFAAMSGSGSSVFGFFRKEVYPEVELNIPFFSKVIFQ